MLPHLLLRELDPKPDLVDYMQLGCMPRISIMLLYVSLHYCRIIIEKKSYLNTRSIELLSGGGGGVHAMNDIVLTKWRVVLNINIGVLENH